MKNKILVFVLLFMGAVNFLWASNMQKDTWSVVEKEFLNAIPKHRNNEFLNYFKTPLFIEAKDFLINEKKFYSAKKNLTNDPHTPEALKVSEVLIPNWPKAFDAFYESATKENNPVSASVAITIMRSYLGALNKGSMLQKRKELSKIMYDHSLCKGYIEYGDIFLFGVASKVDLGKANEIFTSGIEECKNTSNAWLNTVLMMKIEKTKKRK
jgi:hypothetical protein